MGARIERSTAAKPKLDGAEKGLRAARMITGALYYATLFMLLICAVAFAKVAVADGWAAGWILWKDGSLAPWAATAAFFAQLSLGFLAYWVAARQARSIALRAKETGTVFECGFGRCLRVAAAALLLLVLVELAFSLLYLACQGRALLPVNIGFGFAGFPMGWSSLTAGGGSSAFTAQLDTTALLIACLLWGLSHVFDYGAQLQREQDATV